MLFKNLKIDEFKKFHPEFDEDVFVDLKPLNVVKSRNSEGGTSFVQVEKEINNWQKRSVPSKVLVLDMESNPENSLLRFIKL